MKSLLEFSQHPAVHALGWTLLHFLWQGTLLVVLLAGVLAMLSRKPPQLRYVSACCALALMLVLPLITWQHLVATPQIAATNVPVEAHLGPSVEPGWTGAPEPWRDRLAREVDQSVPWVLSIWFAGVVLLWSRLNIGLVVAWRMKSLSKQPASAELQLLLQKLSRRLGVARAVKLVDSALVQVPTVIGWLGPVILIPVGCLVGLSASQVEALLTHELAHIRRHDYLVNIFQCVVETLLFYHPATWWISRQICQEREHCCDDLAVSISGDRLSYVKALSFLEEHRASLTPVALGASGGSLTARVRRLLAAKEPPALSPLAATTALTIVLLATGLCIGAMAHAQSRSSKQPTTEASRSAQALPLQYQRWLDDEVQWIVTPEERAAFVRLTDDGKRDKFIEVFWERRNPTPGSAQNEFREEHYRRIAFANAHYAAANPGSKTDRGRMYIMYGPPDEIDSHPAGVSTLGDQYAKPTEFWRYRSIREFAPTKQVTAEGRTELKAQTVGKLNVQMKFVDVCSCGDYRLESPSKN